MIKYDGCSGGMSISWHAILQRPPPWEACCDANDRLYVKGGTHLERREADISLYECVRKNGHPFWAALMWVGVRFGGAPFWPTPYRWGFGCKYTGRYGQVEETL